jgi:hypothetical protein
VARNKRITLTLCISVCLHVSPEKPLNEYPRNLVLRFALEVVREFNCGLFRFST